MPMQLFPTLSITAVEEGGYLPDNRDSNLAGGNAEPAVAAVAVNTQLNGRSRYGRTVVDKA